MINYIYDGTFEGLLTAFNLALSNFDETVEITTEEKFQPDLFSQIIEVPTDAKLARTVWETFKKSFSEEASLDIGYVFFSEVPDVEGLLFRYIRLLFKKGAAFSQNFSDPVVFQVQRIRNRVSHEIHRYHGFVRFRKLSNGIYYAPIKPDHNVVRFLAPHFKERFADQTWLIHDVKRAIGVFYDGRRCIFLTEVDIKADVIALPQHIQTGGGDFLDEDESDYQALWNQYFQNITITERRCKNLQCQRMPKRYWKFMVEQIED